MSRRSRAREIVLQVLYQSDLNPSQPDDVRRRFVNARLNADRQLMDFAESLILGVRTHLVVLDQHLETTAKNWKLSRMATTDRNVLRLGAYEILFTETPDRVAVNEAIELAKRYGNKNSAQFVNGILDRLMNNKADLSLVPVEEPADKSAENVDAKAAEGETAESGENTGTNETAGTDEVVGDSATEA